MRMVGMEQTFQSRFCSIFKTLSIRPPTPVSKMVYHNHELTSLPQFYPFLTTFPHKTLSQSMEVVTKSVSQNYHADGQSLGSHAVQNYPERRLLVYRDSNEKNEESERQVLTLTHVKFLSKLQFMHP